MQTSELQKGLFRGWSTGLIRDWSAFSLIEHQIDLIKRSTRFECPHIQARQKEFLRPRAPLTELSRRNCGHSKKMLLWTHRAIQSSLWRALLGQGICAHRDIKHYQTSNRWRSSIDSRKALCYRYTVERRQSCPLVCAPGVFPSITRSSRMKATQLKTKKNYLYEAILIASKRGQLWSCDRPSAGKSPSSRVKYHIQYPTPKGMSFPADAWWNSCGRPTS